MHSRKELQWQTHANQLTRIEKLNLVLLKNAFAQRSPAGHTALVVTDDEYHLEGSAGEEEVFEENESEANESSNGSKENEAEEEDSDDNGEYLDETEEEESSR